MKDNEQWNVRKIDKTDTATVQQLMKIQPLKSRSVRQHTVQRIYTKEYMEVLHWSSCIYSGLEHILSGIHISQVRDRQQLLLVKNSRKDNILRLEQTIPTM